ncbi:hypothetical protein QFC22_000726 [Naganishia vaughanmartiniae]|uniref:Uncharacterized protein n=1 Tax=Naganishia vaughanmartiniae TaxID=1424756 RepID=A0ACC2XJZ1_9TREE|nr:hypothetical protein QFC22_000726 [Naganishia vaughanmartiniae]
MAHRIREVWAHNLDDELTLMRNLIDRYPVVSMDTEFPGIVARPIGTFRTGSDYHFQTMRCNVDLLKMIQLGLCLSDIEGNMPEEACCWQFNFQFSLAEDMYAPESIELLKNSGIDFDRLEREGIEIETFAENLITSGLVLFPNVKWVSFHSGYDFGYLLKILTNAPLPPVESEFFNTLHLWFPHVYDIKHIMRSVRNLKGGLQEISDSMGITRIGPQHQAGSDSLLTALAFFRMKKNFFDDYLDDEYYKNFLYGFASAQTRVRYAPNDMINLGASPPTGINPGPSPGPGAFHGIGMSNLNGTPVGTPGVYNPGMDGMGGMPFGDTTRLY